MEGSPSQQMTFYMVRSGIYKKSVIVPLILVWQMFIIYLSFSIKLDSFLKKGM